MCRKLYHVKLPGICRRIRKRLRRKPKLAGLRRWKADIYSLVVLSTHGAFCINMLLVQSATGDRNGGKGFNQHKVLLVEKA